MWRVFFLWFAFLSPIVVGAENENDIGSWYGLDYEYDEATIKDKIVKEFLWNVSSDYDCQWINSESTIYDTRHGMIMTVVLLQPEKVNELYEKRLNGRNVEPSGVFFAGSRCYSDLRRHDGRKLVASFLKI